MISAYAATRRHPFAVLPDGDPADDPRVYGIAIRVEGLQDKPMSADEMKRMIHTFVVATDQGERVYTGHVSSRSPSTITLLLTAPYDAAGRVVKLATTDVISEQIAA